LHANLSFSKSAWAVYGHHHYHEVDADGLALGESEYPDATHFVDSDGNFQSAPQEYETPGVATTLFVSSLRSILQSRPNIECDPARFNRFCDQNSNLPHKVALIEVDELGPKRLFVALSHGAERHGQFSMSDVMRRVVNEAIHPNTFPFAFEAEEGGDAADREWEKATFGKTPRVHCRPTEPLDFQNNKELLLDESWCTNDNEMCLQDSRPWRSGDYSLSTVCDDKPCGDVIIVETYKTGKLIEDYLPLFCAYATHHRMHRIPRPSASTVGTNRRLIGGAWPGHAARDEFRAFLPIFSVTIIILALVWMIRKRVQALQRKYDVINNRHQELAFV